MALNPHLIRRDFPILNRKIYGKKIIYLDNAATSQKPLQVINAIKKFYETNNANIHRGVHKLSDEATDLYEKARETVASFINAEKSENIVFVRNTTEALNLVAYSWGLFNVNPGDEIVLSIMEHHSNMLPWIKLAEVRNAVIKIVDVDDYGRLSIDDLEEKITEKTKLVAITHMSNVTGVINDVKKVTRIAKRRGAVVVVDGAQSVPHMPVDVRNIGADFMAFSGHKMLGPTGIGVLYVSEERLNEMNCFLTGGGVIKEVHYVNGGISVKWAEPPWLLEAGTPNIAGAVGLMEAVNYLRSVGLENIRRHEIELVKHLLDRFADEFKNIRLCGPLDIVDRGGIVSFTIGLFDPHSTAIFLDSEGIAVRSGFHCAQPLHEKLGFTRGSVRASFYIYNTVEEVDFLVEALKRIVQ